ncbi:MAG: hypothetical protein IPG71_05190 [bacterium]|nr:hypothetical protein [bacterium]
MCSKRALWTVLALSLTCSASFAQSDSLYREWRFLATQNELIKSNKPYVVLDAAHQELEIRIGSGVVWTMHEDSGTKPLDVNQLALDFQPDTALVFGLSGLRLLKYEPRFPDSLLEIVSNAMDMDPSLLQREIPVMFEVKWLDGPTLMVHSLPENQPVEIEVPWREKLGLWLQSFSGSSGYEVQCNREVALTLYRVLKNGALTLVLR